MPKLFPLTALTVAPIVAAIAGLPTPLLIGLMVAITLYAGGWGCLFLRRAVKRLDLQNDRYDLENERRRRLLPPPPRPPAAS